MQGYKQIEALAAIGEAVLTAAAGNAELADKLREVAWHYTSDNGLRKALSELCEDAAENAEWQLSREAGKFVPGREQLELVLDELMKEFAERERRES